MDRGLQIGSHKPAVDESKENSSRAQEIVETSPGFEFQTDGLLIDARQHIDKKNDPPWLCPGEWARAGRVPGEGASFFSCRKQERVRQDQQGCEDAHVLVVANKNVHSESPLDPLDSCSQENLKR
jgi:hypothetical protein